ncbi:MAG: methionyl-tRNA formyltransferase [Elusimicrobia bacterium]|nr:methionyl-tRNA formyltransferase [Elusimicrobiota bacterium]
MKIVFLGTPEISCAFLERLVKDGLEVVGVVSQPDKPQGRGLCIGCPPVKTRAEQLKLKVFQPKTRTELSGVLRSIEPDLCVAVAYGRLLKKEELEIPKTGFLNVHFSLLPKYRGAAPVQWALIHGEKTTGVTIFWIDEGMDTGPVFSQKQMEISGEDDAFSLFGKLADAGVEMLSGCIKEIEKGSLPRIPQTGEPSCAPMLTAGDALIDFKDKAVNVHNKIRALKCGPRARFICVANGRKISVQVIKSSMPGTVCGFSGCSGNFAPGSISAVVEGKGIFIKCGEGYVLLERLQPEAGKAMTSVDFINGFRLKKGDVLGVL